MSFTWLKDVDPFWGTCLVTALYVAVLLWALAWSRERICEDAKDQRRWRDLRLWILPLILIQIGLYWLFR
jgi:hypothetical protein